MKISPFDDVKIRLNWPIWVVVFGIISNFFSSFETRLLWTHAARFKLSHRIHYYDYDYSSDATSPARCIGSRVGFSLDKGTL